MSAHGRPILLVSSAAVLAVVAAVAVMVAERFIAAAWQVFKFWGYGTQGVITLSEATGWLFLGVVGVLGGAAFVLRALALRQSSPLAAKVSGCSLALLFAAAAAYAALGFSPLNHWRP